MQLLTKPVSNIFIQIFLPFLLCTVFDQLDPLQCGGYTQLHLFVSKLSSLRNGWLSSLPIGQFENFVSKLIYSCMHIPA